jgi:hypothetical protein
LALLVELAFWSSRSLGRLEAAAPRMAALIATLSRDARARALLTQLYVYLLRAAPPEVEDDEVRVILEQIAGPGGREDIMNAGERLIEQGRVEGLAKGQAEGLAKGRVEGQAEGLAKGQAEGLAKGRVEGQAEGLAKGLQGLRTAIVAALSARGLSVSVAGQARIASCSDVETLTRWLASAVTAAVEADVFRAETL